MCHPEVPEGQEAPPVEAAEVSVPVSGGNLPALLATSPGRVKGAVLIVGDIFGRSPFYENLGARLATAGFAALVPEIFHRQGPLASRTLELAVERRRSLDENLTQDDLLQALQWLQSKFEGARLATIGFCMGGTQVLDLTARRDDLATVCYYGFPARLPSATNLTAPAPLEIVERMHGPILGFWGDQDHGAGMDNVETLRQALADLGVEASFTVYPGLSHGFMAASNLDPDQAGYESACDAWTKTLAFLNHHLAPGQTVR